MTREQEVVRESVSYMWMGVSMPKRDREEDIVRSGMRQGQHRSNLGELRIE